MENVLLGNVPTAATPGINPTPLRSPAQPVDAPPFSDGGIVETKVNPVNVDTTANPNISDPNNANQDSDQGPAPSGNNLLMLAGAAALLFFLFKRKK